MIQNLHQVMEHLEKGWQNRKILVVGDVMLDKYVWGDVARISAEAPVPILRTTHLTEQPGGAANVAANIAHLGARTVLAGFIGDDEDGRILTRHLAASGISGEFVQCQEFPTIAKTRILAGRQQMLRMDTERIAQRHRSDYRKLIDSSLSLMQDSDAVVLSDYAKGTLDYEVCQTIIQASRKAGKPVLVDPKSTSFEPYRGATTVCPNLAELAATLHAGSRDIDELLNLAEHLVNDFEFDFLTATLSDKGIALLHPPKRYVAPAVARQVFDVSGAGDTVIAVMALCLASGMHPEIAIQLANVAAGIVVGKVGTVPVEKHELVAALSADFNLSAVEKIMTREQLQVRSSLWRANGDRLVFTNGCFDLLHVGHITLLEQARRMGDRLIVGINSDGSVSELKGPSRPIVGQADRARILAALSVVDAVVVFEESTPLELICATRPDVLVKGGDYTPETVVGAQELDAWGGEVRIVPLVQGFSTTRLVAKSQQGGNSIG